jgi:hypothetical protein
LEEKVLMSNELIEPWSRLQGKVADCILIAPKTGGDPSGNWLKVHNRVVTYLEKSVVGKLWLNHLALIAAIMTAQRRQVNTVSNTISVINCRFCELFPALDLLTIDDWDVEIHMPMYLKGDVLPRDSRSKRVRFYLRYKGVTKLVWGWFKTLSDSDKKLYQDFVLPIVNQYIVDGLVKCREIELSQQLVRKSETDALLFKFPEIRAVAHQRYNKIVRLRQKWYEVVENLKISQHCLPLTFSYTEGDEQLYFRIWDRRSFVLSHQDSYSISPITQARKGLAAFCDENNHLFLEFVKAEPLTTETLTCGFWFEDLLKQGVIGQGPRCIGDEEIANRQQAWLKSWGYGEESLDNRVTPFWTQVSGLLSWPLTQGQSAFMRKAQAKASGILIPVEPFYAAATFGLLAVDLFTTTGMRINEAMQIRLTPDCFVRLEIPATTANKLPTLRYLFRLIPKGERSDTPHDYFIGEETKRLLVKVAKMLEEHYSLRTSEAETLPAVNFHPGNGRSHRFGKAPYLFQYNYKGLPDTAITACMRFLLHGMLFKTSCGQNVIIKAHLLRHVFATHAVQIEKIPVDIVGAWLKQKNLDVTNYYSQPTASIVAETSDLFLAHLATHINVSEAILRSPIELKSQYESAKKLVGTLTEVNGGYCTYHAFCFAQFACNGCSAKVPDPKKRYQVLEKRKWAESMLIFTTKEGLLPEAERMKQLIRNCDAELQEMNLIEQYQEDEKHYASVQIEK